MSNSKINTFSAIMLTLSIVISYITSSLPRTLVSETKSATLLNILYILLTQIYQIQNSLNDKNQNNNLSLNQ